MSITMHADARQRGFTLTELMIALVLGALVVLAATAMVVSSRTTYRTQDEATRLAENGRFAVELLSRQLRQSGYAEFGDSTAPPASFTVPTALGGDVLNDYAQTAGNDNGSVDFASPINGSDILAVWYYGSGPAGGAADGNIVDCAGFGVANPAANLVAYPNAHVRMVFEVVRDTDGEPALTCRRDTYDPVTFSRNRPLNGGLVMVRGVEDFQVLYGEGIYAPGADPDSSAPTSIVYRTGQGGMNPVVNWANLVSVRFALLLRSNVGAQVDTTPQTYSLFGSSYAPSGDPGVQFSTAGLSVSERTRLRRVVGTTVFMRNRQASWPALCQTQMLSNGTCVQ